MKKRRSKATGILLIAFVLFAAVLGALIFRKYHTATGPVARPPQAEPAGTAIVTLFFASPDGKGLVREGREVEVEDGVEERIEGVLDELVSGPIGSSSATLPANTRVLSVKVTGTLAQIDFGAELKDVIQAGPSAEAGAIYSIVDTVATNFPQVKAVQILIEGAPLETQPGHPDLGKPLPPDYSLEGK